MSVGIYHLNIGLSASQIPSMYSSPAVISTRHILTLCALVCSDTDLITTLVCRGLVMRWLSNKLETNFVLAKDRTRDVHLLGNSETLILLCISTHGALYSSELGH